ncbi:MAG TPA: DNA polymerase/3'-5' exonuclease PolX [Oscillatoriaceae cyanobacterium]
MEKSAIVGVLEEMAVLMELHGENPFKVRAFQNGARVLETFEGDVAAAVANGELKQVKGIGAGLFADIRSLVETGGLPVYEKLKAETPAGLLEMLSIPGLGPKKIKAIHEGLGISSVGELEYACLENRLVDLPGFGEKTQTKILKSLEFWKKHRGRFLYAEALPVAQALEAAIARMPGVERVVIAGSLRRKAETVKDVDLVAVASHATAVMAAFVSLPDVEQITGQGETKSSVRLKNGLNVDLRVFAAEDFAYGLLHFTGSQAFNTTLRQRAKARGLKLNEYGLWRDEERLPASEESDILAHLDLPYLPPELREDRGEIAEAEAGRVPVLVTDQDLLGVFHVHTHASDGEASVRDMALRARALGYKYIGISDHSASAVYARGLTAERLAEQQSEIRALNEELDGITILSGVEADILADGALDYDEAILARLDFVIGSVHSRFGQDRAQMTARLVRAVSHPQLTMLGHLTGRLLLSREAYEFDLEAVLQAAVKHGKIVELNANPHRLDIDWRDLKRVRELGLQIAINPDAHSLKGLEDTRFGVAVARKGGIRAEDVFNAQSLEVVTARLRQ